MSRPDFPLKHFTKASRSEQPPNCVHIARGLGWVIVRDTKQEFGSDTDHRFGFSTDQFDAFQEAIRAANLRTAVIPAGVLDGCCIVIERRAVNENVFRSAIEQDGLPADATLVYTDGEVTAFFDAVLQHEFDEDGEYATHTAECDASCSVAHVALASTV